MAVLIKNADGTTVNTTKTSSTGSGGSSGFTPNDALKNKTVASQWDMSQHQGTSSAPVRAVNSAAAPAVTAAAGATGATASTAVSAPLTLEQQLAQRQAANQATYNTRTAENQALYNQRQAAAQNTYAQRNAEDLATFNQRNADAQSLYNQRQGEDQNLYNQRQAEASKTAAQRNAEAQNLYNQRLAGLQSTYDQRQADLTNQYNQRTAASEGKINSLYDSALAAQRAQLQAGLDQSIQAQEEARAGIAQAYQTAANDLSAQYERNRRNLNMQALAQGLNTGTGSQQQLALNQGWLRSYGDLRGEESAQNAAIDRAVANLKVNYQGDIAKAIADNDYQRAAALMDDYNSNMNWYDNMKLRNQDYYDQQAMQLQNRFDSLTDQARNYLDSQTLNNQNRLDSNSAQNRSTLDSRQLQNQSTYDSQRNTNRNYLDNQALNNQNRFDTTLLNNQNRLDTSNDTAQNWYDNRTLQQEQNARQDAQEMAKTLASFGDFSGYASLYGQQQADAMRTMWIAQNPDLAWRTGAIGAEDYRRMTGEYPVGYTPAGGGGGSGGTWYPWMGGGGSGSGGSTFGTPNTAGSGSGSNGGSGQTASLFGVNNASGGSYFSGRSGKF